MVLRLNDEVVIENPGRFPAESVERLRTLLAQGVPAQADARRQNFYEVESGDRVYWIHVSPISGRVVLLAEWNRPAVAAAFKTQSRAA